MVETLSASIFAGEARKGHSTSLVKGKGFSRTCRIPSLFSKFLVPSFFHHLECGMPEISTSISEQAGT
jgi:hypothetical protein